MSTWSDCGCSPSTFGGHSMLSLDQECAHCASNGYCLPVSINATGAPLQACWGSSAGPAPEPGIVNAPTASTRTVLDLF